MQNCFHKAGFDDLSEEAAPKESDSDTDVEQDLQEQLHFLRRNGMAGLENVDPEDYINADKEITIAGNLTNHDIVAHVQGKNGVTEDLDDSDDDVEAVIPEVTLGEAQMCIDKLRQYIQAQEDASHFFSSLDTLDKYLDNRKGLMMQSKIADFFKSK